MNVQELMKLLGTLQPNTRILVDGIESGYDDVEVFTVETIPSGYDCFWDGKHTWVEQGESGEQALYFKGLRKDLT